VFGSRLQRVTGVTAAHRFTMPQPDLSPPGDGLRIAILAPVGNAGSADRPRACPGATVEGERRSPASQAREAWADRVTTAPELIRLWGTEEERGPGAQSRRGGR
jgi:hypothetical protein